MTNQTGSQRILIVDDEPEIHSILGKVLSSNNYKVDSAYSASEAKTSIENDRPNLIILDIMMPEISGIELCNELKSNPDTKDILILILSARDSQSDRLEGLAKGADDYEAKPFHLKSLVRKIEHMLQKKSEEDFNQIIGR